MPDPLDFLEAHGHLVSGRRRYSTSVRTELLAMSPATIDLYLGPDFDGSEFINWELFRWCEQDELTFTRSRSENKNDGAHVEQNWHIVRQTVGYHSFDTPAELELLNSIWELQRLLTNHFAPQQKLVKKVRNGAKISKKYDAGNAVSAGTRRYGHGLQGGQDEAGAGKQVSESGRDSTSGPRALRRTARPDHCQAGHQPKPGIRVKSNDSTNQASRAS